MNCYKYLGALHPHIQQLPFLKKLTYSQISRLLSALRQGIIFILGAKPKTTNAPKIKVKLTNEKNRNLTNCPIYGDFNPK